MPACGPSIGILQEIQCGWGFDRAGRWHQGFGKAVPIRQVPVIDDDARLAPSRGVLWGLLLSFLLFWLPVGAAVQMQAGDENEALMTLQSVQGDAARIDPSRSSSVKKLKNAEILLGQAAFKLKELLMDAPLEDRPPLEKTLKQVNEAQSALLLQVFEH